MDPPHAFQRPEAPENPPGGQPLVVLEAMKMESTLAAEVAGRVSALPASADTTVAAGDLLVEITPDGE